MIWNPGKIVEIDNHKTIIPTIMESTRECKSPHSFLRFSKQLCRQSSLAMLSDDAQSTTLSTKRNQAALWWPFSCYATYACGCCDRSSGKQPISQLCSLTSMGSLVGLSSSILLCPWRFSSDFIRVCASHKSGLTSIKGLQCVKHLVTWNLKVTLWMNIVLAFRKLRWSLGLVGHQ